MNDMPLLREQVLGAVVRGWCHEKNAHKVMDRDLADAITEEVFKLLDPLLTATKVIVDHKLTEAEAEVIKLSNRRARLEAGW